MQPTDPSDAHLGDRAIETRALKAGVIVFVVTLVAVFSSLTFAFGLFAVAYLAYRFTYYSDRVDVFTADGLAVRHNRLELSMVAAGVASLVALLAVEVIFPETWTLGGFLSLPAIDLMDPATILQDLTVPLAWIVVLAPVIAVSYAGYQFRHRLLFGLDSEEAVIRATVWESFARLPVYLIWVGVLTTRPIFELWRPVVELGVDLFGLTAVPTGEFALIFGGGFPAVVVSGIVASLAVIGSYLAIQRWKYDDATIPEVFGDPGLAPPTHRSHQANVVVPIAVFLVFTLAVFVVLDSPPIADLRVAIAALVSVAVGANFLGQTSLLLRSTSEQVDDNVDAVTTGFVAGFVGLLMLSLLLGTRGPLAEMVLAYPIVAFPLTHLGNRLARRYAVDDITEFLNDIESDPDSFEEGAADRLFVYCQARDDTLRATAIEALATARRVSPYRRDDALEVFVTAADSEEPAIVNAGLQGVAAVLERDRSISTYNRLVRAGTPEILVTRLDSDDGVTQARASEAAARLYSAGLAANPTGLEDFLLSTDRIEQMIAAVDRSPDDRELAGAVVRYFSRVWYATAGTQDGTLAPSSAEAQRILGGLLQLSGYADADARLMAVMAVTYDQAPADSERISEAIGRLDDETKEVRYLAVHVVGSSFDWHANRIDPEELLALLEDESREVREAVARTISTFIRSAPDRASGMLDPLVFHLQENLDARELTEGNVIRALGLMDVEDLIEHPTAAPTVAEYMVDTSPRITKPAAEVLSSIVTRDPGVAETESVQTAIADGLTNPSPEVRFDCLEAVVTLVEDSVDAGRRFVAGLSENLSTTEKHSELAVVTLREVLERFPGDGLTVLPALSKGVGNLTPIDRQTVPFVVRGGTVSAVTVDILTDVLPLDPGRGEVLIDPLTEAATSADGAELEGVIQLLSALSAEFPEQCRTAVGTAAALVEDDRVGVRRAAAEVMANVAAQQPLAVEPFVDRLVVAADDDNQRVRAAALAGLKNVCVASPTAIEPDIHRVIGLLDDDSTAVRKHAALLIVVVAEREPAIVQPAAETADRLRRLQRDPAVDVDSERLQDASAAIQTGVPTHEAGEAAGDTEEIWSPETADEMGASGDTNVFVPGDDEFDIDFDDESELSQTPESPDDAVSEVEDMDTAVGSEEDTTGSGSTDEVSDLEPELEESGEADAETADLKDTDTTIGHGGTGDETTESREPPGDDLEDMETAIESTGGPSETADQRDDSDDDLDDLDTVIDPEQDEPDETPGDDVGDAETVIDPDDAPASETPPPGSVDELETEIQPSAEEPAESETTADEGAVDDLETTMEPPEATSGDAEPADVDDMETAIEPGGGSGAGESSDTDDADEVEELETKIGQSDDDDEQGDVGELETVIGPDEGKAESGDSDDDEGTDEA